MDIPGSESFMEDGWEDEVHYVGGKVDTPAPGIAKLPIAPPTVPVLAVMQNYQSIDILRMLTTKLAPEGFKCMFRGCLFADDSAETFQQHAEAHGSNYRCCYCLVECGCPEDLVAHISAEHGHCQYQCRYCLYRTSLKLYLGLHLQDFHPHQEPRYIEVEPIVTEPAPSPPVEQTVLPYKCNFNGCDYKTKEPLLFKKHVKNTHGYSTVISCSYCDNHHHYVELMIEHMKKHHLNKYQCPYCVYGAGEKEGIHIHLLISHPGREGRVLLRKT